MFVEVFVNLKVQRIDSCRVVLLTGIDFYAERSRGYHFREIGLGMNLLDRNGVEEVFFVWLRSVRVNGPDVVL